MKDAFDNWSLERAAALCMAIAAEWHRDMMSRKPGGIKAREACAASVVAERCAKKILDLRGSPPSAGDDHAKP